MDFQIALAYLSIQPPFSNQYAHVFSVLEDLSHGLRREWVPADLHMGLRELSVGFKENDFRYAETSFDWKNQLFFSVQLTEFPV